MGNGIKGFLALVFMLSVGCAYLPQSANWPLSDQQTMQWQGQSKPLKQGVLHAFSQHQVVAVGDYHWNNRVMNEINNLVKQPDFLNQVKQVVVEFGNSRHQQSLDDFLNGKSHDNKVLDDVRRDALFFAAWMPDEYKSFFLHIRKYNLAVEDSEKVKVWLAEAPFYWEKTQNHEQWQQAANQKSDGFFQQAQKAIATGDKVFMVFGAFHLLNIHPVTHNGPLPLATLLKQAYPNNVYTIWPVTEPEINQALSGLNIPTLLPTNMAQGASVTLVDILPKARIRLGRIGHEQDSLQQLVDGLMYVGSSKRNAQFPQSVMDDKDWLAEMEARLNIVGGRSLSMFKSIVANSQ